MKLIAGRTSNFFLQNTSKLTFNYALIFGILSTDFLLKTVVCFESKLYLCKRVIICSLMQRSFYATTGLPAVDLHIYFF
jgi:hypothetical protein